MEERTSQSSTATERRGTPEDYRFRVEPECYQRETGYGDRGRVVEIRHWSAAPFDADTCPQCGYDRIRETTIWNHSDDQTTWECDACGLDGDAIREHQERLDTARAAAAQVREEWERLADELGWRDEPASVVAAYHELLNYQKQTDNEYTLLAETAFDHEDVYDAAHYIDEGEIGDW